MGLRNTAVAFMFLCVPATILAEIEPPTPTNWEEFDALAESYAPVVSVLAAEIENGQCNVVHDLNSSMTTPIGSSFKLYILAEIAAQIVSPTKATSRSNGPISWNSLITIKEKYKSIPGGPLLFVPDGSIFTVRYLAEQMIQRSDNTATDHLLFLAGRKNVERRMASTKHHDPSLNIPLFGTRVFAVIKFLWSDQELQNYMQASNKKRRKLLAKEKRGWTELEAFFDVNGDQTEPVRVETVEWYADRYDMCELMKSIHDFGKKPGAEPLLEVLTLADPVNFDREKWVYVGFKGGSETGLQSGNWLVERNDGRLFFFSATFLDPDQPLDLGNIIPLLIAAPDLLFATP